MRKILFLLFLVILQTCSSLFAVEPPVAPPTQPVADQCRQTSERFGFVIRAGSDFSKESKAWKIARFVRLFYVGYALSQSQPKDVRAEVFRRSIGNNNASWSDLWGAAKDMVKQVAGSGEGMVDLLFSPIAGLENPDKQYDRMLRDPDYIPCSGLVLEGLLKRMESILPTEPFDGGAQFRGAEFAETGALSSEVILPANNDSSVRDEMETSDGRPSDKALEDSETAMAYMRSLLEAKLRGEVDTEHWLRETKRTEAIQDRVNGVTPEQRQARAANAAKRSQRLRKMIICRDCRGTGWGPPIPGSSAPKFAGAGTEVRLEYCKGCGGVATTDHRHNSCHACRGLGKRHPYLSEIDMD